MPLFSATQVQMQTISCQKRSELDWSSGRLRSLSVGLLWLTKRGFSAPIAGLEAWWSVMKRESVVLWEKKDAYGCAASTHQLIKQIEQIELTWAEEALGFISFLCTVCKDFRCWAPQTEQGGLCCCRIHNSHQKSSRKMVKMVKMGGASNSLPMSNAAVRQNTGFKSCHDCLVSPWPLFHADTMLKSWSRYVYTSNLVQSCAEFQIKVHWQQFVQATSWRISLSAPTQHLTSRVDDTDRNEMIWDMALSRGDFIVYDHFTGIQ